MLGGVAPSHLALRASREANKEGQCLVRVDREHACSPDSLNRRCTNNDTFMGRSKVSSFVAQRRLTMKHSECQEHGAGARPQPRSQPVSTQQASYR